MRIRRQSFEHAFAAALDDAAREGVAELQTALHPELEGAIMQALEELVVGSGHDPSPAAPSAGYRDELAASGGFEGEVGQAGERGEPPGGPPGAPALKPGIGVEALRKERRRLALANHPDRVPPEQREAASRAMAEINAEIDRALEVEKMARSR